jgi:hypothetical protein
MRRVFIIGILVGGVADVCLTILLGLPVLVYVVLEVHAARVPTDQVRGLTHSAMHRPQIYLSFLMIGSICSIIGGYISALISKHDELLNGCLSSFLCIVVGILSIMTHSNSDPISRQVCMLIASPMLGSLGGYLRLRQKRGYLRSN